jgi:predicted subunit of tRNA(5-methylaminomethyl-2-thiouridylate) methyltransferase
MLSVSTQQLPEGKLESLLEDRTSEHSRSYLILRLTRAGYTVPQDIAEQAIQNLSHIPWPQDAAEIAKRLGMNRRAVQVYQDLKSNYSAVKEAHELGLTGVAEQLFNEFIENPDGSPMEKINLAELLGKSDQVQKLQNKYLAELKQSKRYEDSYSAAKLAAKLGHRQQAINLYLKTDHVLEAANLIVELGDPERAVNLLGEKGYFKNAALLASSNNLPNLVMQYSKLAVDKNKYNSGDAAETAREIGLPELAIGIAEENKIFDLAAELATEANQPERAATLYQKAINRWDSLGKFKEALKSAEKGRLTVEIRKYQNLLTILG